MKKNVKKYTIIIILSMIIILALVLGIVGLNANKFKLDISNTNITKDTYIQIMNQNISDVTKYFREKGINNTDSDFWNKEVEGKTAYEVLTDKTLDELKYITAVYQIAEEKGYIEKGSLENIWDRMEKENKSREKSIKEGKPVYGLSEFSIDTFLEYEMDTLQKSYCEVLDNEGMNITDADREKYYNENKDKLFVKDDDISISYIKIDYEQQGLSDEQYQSYKDTLTQIYKNSGENNHLQDLVKDNSQLNSYFEHIDLKSSEIGAYSRVIPDILEYAYDLKPNEMTSVIDENGSLYLIECTDRVDYDYQPLDSVRDNINKTLREENYEKIVKERAEKLVVNVNVDNLYKFTKRNI